MGDGEMRLSLRKRAGLLVRLAKLSYKDSDPVPFLRFPCRCRSANVGGELRLQALLGSCEPRYGRQRNLELPGAGGANRYDGSWSQPLCDSQIARCHNLERVSGPDGAGRVVALVWRRVRDRIGRRRVGLPYFFAIGYVFVGVRLVIWRTQIYAHTCKVLAETRGGYPVHPVAPTASSSTAANASRTPQDSKTEAASHDSPVATETWE